MQPRAVVQPVDLGDVRMIQRREDLRFALEPGDAVRIVGEDVREDLDRDFAPQLRIARAINLSHAAAAEGSDDLVRPDARAGLDHHAERAELYAPEVGTPRHRDRRV